MQLQNPSLAEFFFWGFLEDKQGEVLRRSIDDLTLKSLQSIQRDERNSLTWPATPSPLNGTRESHGFTHESTLLPSS